LLNVDHMKTFLLSSVCFLGLASSLAVPACSVKAQPSIPGSAGEGGSGNEPDDPTCRIGKPSFTHPGDECARAEEGKECKIDGGDDPCLYGPYVTCRGGEWKAETGYSIDCSDVRLDASGCPLDLGKADGKACVPPKIDGCNPAGSEFDFKCVDGKWQYTDVPDDLGSTCDGETVAGDECNGQEQGKTCGETSGDPCSFGHSLICQSGSWQDQEATPDPACQKVELDEEGCPVDHEKAKGKACEPPKADDCNGSGSEFGFDCVGGLWTVTDIGKQPTCSDETKDGDDCNETETGDLCGETTGNPCGFGHSLVCNGQKWVDQESTPGPCGEGGAGGAN
jgi:hypothetical protein